MRLHVGVSGWLLGPPSGANRRLLALLGELGGLLQPDERITVLHRPDWSPPALPRIGWCPVAIAAGPTLRRALDESRQVARTLQRLGANVFDHGFLPLPHVPMPSCLLLHDLRAVDGFSRWPRWLARAALRNSAARADAIVVPSAFTAGRVRAVLGAGTRVHVVRNGTTLPPGPAAAPAGHLLHVGHLEPRKNLDVLLRALALLPAGARPPLELVGHDAGAGRRLRALAARLGLIDTVRFRGRLDDAATGALYATARAVVVPSRYEGFGLCALEGLAHGRPVLVAAAGALPEVVGHDVGVALPPDEAEAWSHAILATADDSPERAARRRAYAGQFSWQEPAASLLAVWRALAAE